MWKTVPGSKLDKDRKEAKQGVMSAESFKSSLTPQGALGMSSAFSKKAASARHPHAGTQSAVTSKLPALLLCAEGRTGPAAQVRASRKSPAARTEWAGRGEQTGTKQTGPLTTHC